MTKKLFYFLWIAVYWLVCLFANSNYWAIFYTISFALLVIGLPITRQKNQTLEQNRNNYFPYIVGAQMLISMMYLSILQEKLLLIILITVSCFISLLYYFLFKMNCFRLGKQIKE